MRKKMKVEEFKRVRVEVMDMTQAQVAEIVGISLLTYQKWENGQTIPRVDNFVRFVELEIQCGHTPTLDEWFIEVED